MSKIIILRECEGHLSIMKGETSNRLKFDTVEDALTFIESKMDSFKITDKFIFVSHMGEADISEEIQRVLRITVEKP